MASATRVYPDGVTIAERWTSATLPSDASPAGYTAFNADGTVSSSRALIADELAGLLRSDAAYSQLANKTTVSTAAQAALTANLNDLTQDQTIITQAATITAGSITNLATAAAAIAKLAQAVAILAGNDQNTKRELTALIRLVLAQFDSAS